MESFAYAGCIKVTALFNAAKRGDVDVCRRLLRAQADPHVALQNWKQSTTPAEVASKAVRALLAAPRDAAGRQRSSQPLPVRATASPQNYRPSP